MQDWEFLIQQQGDLTWLPLESPAAEILAGCYQVIAHPLNSDLAVGHSVTVQVTRLFARDGIPQRHFEQRSQRITPDGLVIIPFTFLEAGLWTLCCSRSQASGLDAAADPEAESVQLQVLPQESEIPDAPLPGLPLGIKSEPASALPTLAISWEPVAFQLPRPKRLKQIASALLSLDQAAYRAMAGECLTVTGQAAISGTLELCLLEVKTAQVLHRQQQPLADPSDQFTCTFEVPTGYPEILGEITLLEAGDLSAAIETQAFRIAVDSAVSAPALKASSENQQRQSPTLDLPTFSQSRANWCLQVVPVTLPPKIHQSSSQQRLKPPQLPVLPRPQPLRVPLAVQSGSRVRNESASMAAAFEALRLRERFWLTLDSLSREIIAGDEPLEASPRTTSLMEPAILEEAPSHHQVSLPALSSPSQDSEALTPVQTLLAPEVSVPEILLAGTPLRVSVRLPLTPSNLGVKLWVYDSQTQAVLEGPRWLTDFKPNPQLEVLETATQIVLPLQVTEVDFAAIAVDLSTQQESPKTVVHRRIDPVNAADGLPKLEGL